LILIWGKDEDKRLWTKVVFSFGQVR